MRLVLVVVGLAVLSVAAGVLLAATLGENGPAPAPESARPELSDAAECAAAFPDPIGPQLPELILVFTGDNLLGARLPGLVDKHGQDWPYALVRETLSGADLAFGNLECPITSYGVHTPGKTDESLAAKENFVFKAPPEWSGRLLAGAGFDVVSLANNHAMDYCGQGLLDTCAILDAAAVAYAGGGENAARARAPVIIERRGLRIGFLARSNVAPLQSEAGKNSAGIAVQGKEYDNGIGHAIRQLSQSADIVVVSFHWGYENSSQYDKYQQQLARQAIDDGADLVIGHHPHCLQGVELYHGGVIAYSLGNFLFTGKSALLESVVLRVTMRGGNVERAELLPVWVRGGRPEPAPEDAKLIEHIRQLCTPCGVELMPDGEWLAITPDASGAGD